MPSESTHRGNQGDTARATRKDSRALGLSQRTSHRHDHVVRADALKLLRDPVADS